VVLDAAFGYNAYPRLRQTDAYSRRVARWGPVALREKTVKTISIALLAGAAFYTLIGPVSAEDPGRFTEKVVYSFAEGAAGSYPSAALIDVAGTLFSTAPSREMGGGPKCHVHFEDCGTVFSFEPDTDAVSVLHTFGIPRRRGQTPFIGLVDVNGRLYGATADGGAYENGTIFSINRHTGTEKVLYSFCSQQNCADGADPDGLINVGGMLYGTSALGGEAGCGKHGCGTVFSLNLDTGAETVLYSFTGGTDGAYPIGGLIDVDGVLYGATARGGGTYEACPKFGCGTVFALDPTTGAEAVLYAFQGGADGDHPRAGLISLNGVLYGTTFYGGDTSHNRYGFGTIFALDPGTSTHTILHAFSGGKEEIGSGKDGGYPSAGLIDVHGKLYGTTMGGGKAGAGTAFSIDPTTGAEKVLHSFFTVGTDGAYPAAGLIDVKDTLYGTTQSGGGGNCSYPGCGTIFSLTKQ